MKNKSYELEIIKGLAILGVLLIHVTAEGLLAKDGGHYAHATFLQLNELSRFAVPSFFFASGFGLSLSKYYDFKDYFQKRILKVVPLYLFWSFLCLGILRITNPVLILKSLVLGKSFYHLWFVPIVIQFYLLFPLLRKFSNRNWFIVVSFIISLYAWFLSFYFPDHKFVYLFAWDSSILHWFFYFALGMWISPNITILSKNLKKIRWIFPISLLVVFGFQIRLPLIQHAVLALLVWAIVWGFQIQGLIRTFLINLSRLSYGIYLSHAFFLYIYAKAATYTGLRKETFLFGISAYIIVLFSSYLASGFLDTLFRAKIPRTSTETSIK